MKQSQSLKKKPLSAPGVSGPRGADRSEGADADVVAVPLAHGVTTSPPQTGFLFASTWETQKRVGGCRAALAVCAVQAGGWRREAFERRGNVNRFPRRGGRSMTLIGNGWTSLILDKMPETPCKLLVLTVAVVLCFS